MFAKQRGAIVGRIAGIIICGGVGGVAAWALVTALGWDGTIGAIVAAVVGMVVAVAVFTAGTSLLRAFGWTR